MSALEPGTVHEEVMVVEEQHTAVHLRTEGVYVLATPFMVALMEATARNLADSRLEPGHKTVGTSLNIKHLAATPLGMRVTARAELASVAGRKLNFKVEAFDEQEKIGEGAHTRVVVNLDRYMEKIRSKAATG